MTVSSRLYRFAAALLIAGALAPSCREEGTEKLLSPREEGKRTVVFTASEIQTKTSFGEGQNGVYPAYWTQNDSYVKLALGYCGALDAAVQASEDFRTAGFAADFDFSSSEAPYTFYAVSPASAAKAQSASRKAWSISIPSDQTPLDSSVDESAMLLAAASKPYDQAPDKVEMHFDHITAYGRLSFTNLELDGAAVNKVEITATTPLAGDWYWNCEEGGLLSDNGSSSTITIHTSKTSDIWFACAPADMSGEMAVFTVYTDKGAFVKEVEFPSGRKFTSGRIAAFSVDMSGIGPAQGGGGSFCLVKDAGTLSAGDEIIIANSEGTYALGPQSGTSSKPYRSRVAVTTSSETIADAGTATVFTLVNGASDGTWALMSDKGTYLCATTSGNYLSEDSSIKKSSSWAITISSTGQATICAQGGGSTFIRENTLNPRFSAYSSSSSLKDPVAVYCRKSGSAIVVDDPLAERYDYGIYQSEATRVYVPGTDQYSRRYSASGELTFAIINPESKEQLEISGYRKSLVKGDALTVTVNWRKGRNKVMSATTYRVFVVKEEGPRVWLGNGTGNGFIIKK